MDAFSHYEKLIRQIGLLAIMSLLSLNAVGGFLSLMILAGQPSAGGVHSASIQFLIGMLAAFGALMTTWVIAQLGFIGRSLSPILQVALMLVPPALALLFFLLGFLTLIRAVVGE